MLWLYRENLYLCPGIMEMNMKYGIIGTGAIGGYYGAKLAHGGQEVHFLLHRDYEYVKQNGLQVHIELAVR